MTTLDEVRAPHNVVAAFGELNEARAAILAVEQSGIDPGMISLLGAWPGEGDAPTGDLLVRTAIGGGIGAVAVGIATTTLTIVTVDSGASITWWGAGLAGMIAGAFLGALIGAYAGTGSSTAWQDTFAADGAGSFVVGVHSEDETDIEVAEGALRGCEPMIMNRFGGERSVVGSAAKADQ